MIAPSSTLVAAFGVALMSVLIHNSEGQDGNDTAPEYQFSIDEIPQRPLDFPQSFKERQKFMPVVQDWEQMYDSAFLPNCYERSYGPHVLSLLFDMKSFLDEQPDLEHFLRIKEVKDVRYYYEKLINPSALSLKELAELLKEAQERPDYNPRHLKYYGPCPDNHSPLVDLLRSLLANASATPSKPDTRGGVRTPAPRRTRFLDPFGRYV